jgi:large subunit ribosomal protein L15
MNIHQLKPKTPRTYGKRVGRGGQRGKTSGKGTKGQASRAGAGIKPGFRGGDNRIWQLFPKSRGSSHKSGGAGNNRLHRKHRYFQLKHDKPLAVNLDFFNQFSEGQEITPEMLGEKTVKVLGNGILKKRVSLKGFTFSASAKEKAIKAGAKII